jgi:hypothetical protein
MITDLGSAGRPCSPSAPCGPGTTCHPSLHVCIAEVGLDTSRKPRAPADAGPPEDAGLPVPGADARLDVSRVAADLTVPDELVAAPDAAPAPVDAAPPTPDAAPPPPLDKDGDKVPDNADNCPATSNASQADLDKDGAGDACDDDIDGDTLPNTVDPFPASADVVYYYKTADMLLQDGSYSGNWTASGTSLCQNSYHDGYGIGLKSTFIPDSDYLVETQFTILATEPGATDTPGPGIDVRVTSGGSSGYDCTLDTEYNNLVIGEYSSWYPIASSTPQTVPTSGPYRMRMVAKGSYLSCEIVGVQTKAQVNDPSKPYGTVGVFTYLTKTCFDYLLVIKAP